MDVPLFLALCRDLQGIPTEDRRALIKVIATMIKGKKRAAKR